MKKQLTNNKSLKNIATNITKDNLKKPLNDRTDEIFNKLKKETMKISSIEEKLFYCFLKDFQDKLCNNVKKENLTFRERIIYELISNKKSKDKINELIVKQLTKGKNSLEGAIIYILFYKKKDITDFNLTFLEYFLLKRKFPDLKANFNQSPFEQRNKPTLIKIAKLLLENKKITENLIPYALKEAKDLYDFLILEGFTKKMTF